MDRLSDNFVISCENNVTLRENSVIPPK